jgi:hypothetical protein
MDELPEIQPQLKRQRAAPQKRKKKEEEAKSMDIEVVPAPEEVVDTPVAAPAMDMADIVEKIQRTIDEKMLNEREFHLQIFKRQEANLKSSLQATLESINDTHVIMKKGFKSHNNSLPYLLQPESTREPQNDFIWNTHRSLYE